ncbi:MAG: ATP-binding protein [Alphaproteobacteria bacterium]
MQEWEAFARTLQPSAANLSRASLRDHGQALLDFIAADLEVSQTDLQQSDKSKGHGPLTDPEGAGQKHAEMRFLDGFETPQMVSEFRALRASILKLWDKEGRSTDDDFQDVIRFNEAIDQLLMESLVRYAEKINHAQTLFLGTLVHDMRNPLAATSNCAQLLLMMGGIDDEKAEIVRQIERSTTSLTKLVSDLIDATRVHLGKGLPIEPVPMDMGDTVRQTVMEAKAAQPSKTISVETKGKLEGIWDASRMRQVFSNLINNAQQHGSADSQIEVHVHEEQEGVTLSVHNQGTPIPVKDVAALFDPLTRGEGEKQLGSETKSLGLGLYIVKQIVTAHGGTLDVTSTKEEGTTFFAWLPRTQEIGLRPH